MQQQNWGEREQAMDTLRVLSVCVFALGAALCGFFMVFLVRGKPIPGDTGDHQVVKYRDLELQTNSIISILIISALVAVVPLGLQVWMNLKLNPPLVPPPTEQADIYISGDLIDSSNAANKLANIKLKATNLKTGAQFTVTSDQQGHFDFDPIRVTPGAAYIKLVVDKEGYEHVEKRINLTEPYVSVPLAKRHP
jgi:hypothetical protein